MLLVVLMLLKMLILMIYRFNVTLLLLKRAEHRTNLAASTGGGDCVSAQQVSHKHNAAK